MPLQGFLLLNHAGKPQIQALDSAKVSKNPGSYRVLGWWLSLAARHIAGNNPIWVVGNSSSFTPWTFHWTGPRTRKKHVGIWKIAVPQEEHWIKRLLQFIGLSIYLGATPAIPYCGEFGVPPFCIISMYITSLHLVVLFFPTQKIWHLILSNNSHISPTSTLPKKQRLQISRGTQRETHPTWPQPPTQPAGCLDSSSFEGHPFHHHSFSLEALLGRYWNSPESRSSKCSLSSGFLMAWLVFFLFVVVTYDRCPFQVEQDNDIKISETKELWYLVGTRRLKKTMDFFYVPLPPYWGTCWLGAGQPWMKPSMVLTSPMKLRKFLEVWSNVMGISGY